MLSPDPAPVAADLCDADVRERLKRVHRYCDVLPCAACRPPSAPAECALPPAPSRAPAGASVLPHESWGGAPRRAHPGQRRFGSLLAGVLVGLAVIGACVWAAIESEPCACAQHGGTR